MSDDDRLIYRAGNRLHALPLSHVIEVMRPLPIEPLGSDFPFVQGISIIRGQPTPVVAPALIGAERDTPLRPTRFITIRIETRQIAIMADEVLGIRALPAAALHELPLLLQDADADIISAIGTLDAALLLVLEEARLVPDEIWSRLAEQEITA